MGEFGPVGTALGFASDVVSGLIKLVVVILLAVFLIFAGVTWFTLGDGGLIIALHIGMFLLMYPFAALFCCVIATVCILPIFYQWLYIIPMLVAAVMTFNSVHKHWQNDPAVQNAHFFEWKGAEVIAPTPKCDKEFGCPSEAQKAYMAECMKKQFGCDGGDISSSPDVQARLRAKRMGDPNWRNAKGS